MKRNQTMQYQPGHYVVRPDPSVAVKRRLERLWRDFLTTPMTVDEWCEKANKIDPPVLVDKARRESVMKGQK